ncbi:MAG: S9 family peptidase, partial [Candidatus Limisoma sp.]|nr:S9 family peptidase [Candidatus Limisoma sp.]
PDETKVMFIGSVKYGKTVKDHYPDLDKANAHIVDDLMYKHWDEWVSEIPHPFVADFDGNSLSNIIDVIEGEPFEAPMKPFGGVESLVWAPDSKSIVYVSRKLEGREYAESTNSDLYLYDLATRETTNLTNGMFGYDTNPVFSPKGDKIAWLSMEHDGYESDKNRIFVMDMKSRQKTDLTADWDYTVNDIAWNPDGKSIYFIAHHQGSTPIFSIDVKSHQVTTVADHECDYATIAPVDEHRVVALRHAITYPNEIFMVEAGSATQLSNVNTELLSQLSPVTVEKHMVPTTDGKEMLTWVILPPNFDKTKKYPAILYCQGGPQQAVSQMWSYRWNFRLMASQGYVVIAPNRRGLPGFGTEWNAQISGDYGGQNMKDYLSAVDYMKEKPYIDSKHIGATGASYGGFSVYWLAGNHDNRFAALLAHAGIFNTEAQYLETEEMWFANWDLGGPFWDKSNKIAQRSFENSPHHFVDRWTAPIMITVGERDYRILASQGMQAFNAARLRDIPTRMLVYPDENHWILKPQNALLWQREFFGWFDRWLKPNQE